MTDTCTCPPGDCHGGHTINVGPSWVCLPDDRLRQLRDDPFATRPETVTVDPETQSMAAELLALRAAARDHEGRCETCHRPRFSDRHLAQVTRERDEARALAEDLGRRCDELLAKRNPADDVLVDGSWFHPDDLPKILGNHMRAVAEVERRAKDAVIALEAARARVTELEDARDIAEGQARLYCTEAITARDRVAELEADHARLVEDTASTVRRFSATLDERDALRARVAELEADQAVANKALDEIAGYVQPDEDGMWTDADGLLESIGNTVESTGRKVWEESHG